MGCDIQIIQINLLTPQRYNINLVGLKFIVIFFKHLDE